MTPSASSTPRVRGPTMPDARTTLAQMRAELYGALLQMVGHRWTARTHGKDADTALRITAYNERHGDDGAGGDAYEEMTLRDRDLLPW